MLFGTATNYKAIDIPFNWNAEYANGKNITEYDFETHKKRDFYMIDKTQVVRFGLFGQNMKFYFEMCDGSFNLRGRRIDMEYHLADGSGRVIGLTSNFNKKDIITYKEAYTDLNMRKQGVQQSNLKSINFGYKTNLNKHDINLFFKPIMSLPFNDSALMEIGFTSDKNIDGYLVFKSRGVEVERFYVPLEENRAIQFNWVIK